MDGPGYELYALMTTPYTPLGRGLNLISVCGGMGIRAQYWADRRRNRGKPGLRY